jgi:hypothetical protein
VGSVSDFVIGCTANAGDSVTVVAGCAVLAIGINPASRAYLARQLGAGGRKDYAPLVARFCAICSVAQANQNILLGLVENLTTIDQIAALSPKETATQIHLTTSGIVVGGALVDEVVDMPFSPWTDADPHLYEVDLDWDQVNYFVDRVRVGNIVPDKAEHQGAIPDPYSGLWLLAWIDNTGAGPAAPATLTIVSMAAQSRNVVNARIEQPDESKARVSALGPISRTRPGVDSEELVVSIPRDGAAHTLVTVPATVGEAYYDVAVQPGLTDYDAPSYRRVRFKAPGPATANSKWYSSNDGTFRIGPLYAGETISCWVDVAEPAAVNVSYARVV